MMRIPDKLVERCLFLLATSSVDGTIRLWDPPTRKLVWSVSLREPIACIAFTADGKRLISGSMDRFVRIHDASSGKLLDVEARINLCRTEQQKATPLPFESKALLALSVYLGRQSRGLAVAPSDDTRTRAAIEPAGLST